MRKSLMFLSFQGLRFRGALCWEPLCQCCPTWDPGLGTKGPGNIGTLPISLFSDLQLDRSQLGAMSIQILTFKVMQCTINLACLHAKLLQISIQLP